MRDYLDVFLEERQKALSAIQLISSLQSDAYWISPAGQLIPVGRTHIEEVFNSPEAFGLTEEDIKKAYKRRKEPLHFEGKARQDIMELLINKGWIRIRYTVKADFYTLEVKELTKKVKDWLCDWALSIITANKSRSYSDVIIYELGTGKEIRHSMIEIAGESLYSRTERLQSRCQLILLRSIYEVLDIAPESALN